MLKKRLIAWLLMFALCFYSMPVYAFAQEASDAAGDDTSISENVDATLSDTEASDSETSGAEASDDVTDESDNAETGAPDSEDSDTDEGATEGTDDNGQTAPDEGNAGEDESVGVTPDEGENTDEVIGDENNNSEPAEPADPEQSAGPETLEPTEPEQPAEPTEPADPTEPEQPAEPTEPENPETPAEPEQPTEPVTPEEPTEPEQPTQPVEPQEPVVTPEEPVVPEEPKDIPIEQVPVLPEVNQVVDALQNVAPPVVEVPVVPIVPEISAEVQKAIELIKAVPDTSAVSKRWITQEKYVQQNRAAIENANAAYLALNEADRMLVAEKLQDEKSNVANLNQAVAYYFSYKVTYENKLPGPMDVSISDKDTILALLAEYETFSAEQQTLCQATKNRLDKSMATIAELEEEAKKPNTKEFDAALADLLWLISAADQVPEKLFGLAYDYVDEMEWAIDHLNEVSREYLEANGDWQKAQDALSVIKPQVEAMSSQVDWNAVDRFKELGYDLDMYALGYPELTESTIDTFRSVYAEANTIYTEANKVTQSYLYYKEYVYVDDMEIVGKMIEEFDAAAASKLVPEVIAQIDALPEIAAISVETDAEAIKAARAAYDALKGDAAKGLVTNYDKLFASEIVLRIADLPQVDTITLENKAEIEQIRSDLTWLKNKDYQSALLAREDSMQALQAAEAAIAKLEAAMQDIAVQYEAKIAELQAVIDASNGTTKIDLTDYLLADSLEIVINAKELGNGIVIPAGKDIIFTGDTTLTRSGLSGSLIKIEAGGKLTLAEVRLAGNDDKTAYSGATPIICEGELVVEAGTVITGFQGQNGGAVWVKNGGSLTMNGGEMSNNKAVYGGAVAVSGNSHFVMNGGQLGNNKAQYGGAVLIGHEDKETLPAVPQGNVQLNAGVISGNTASTAGGAIYVGWQMDTNERSYLQLRNVQITNNQANKSQLGSVEGGGIWFCPQGKGSIYATSGAVLTGNASAGKGTDFYSTGYDLYASKIHLPSHLSNGKQVQWYDELNGDKAIANTEFAKWLQNNANNTIALRSEANADGVAAGLLITGNAAPWGGAIACNGELTIGDDRDWSLTVVKEWVDDTKADRPAEISFEVLMDGKATGEIIKLNADNGWKATITDLPDGHEYSVKEIAVPGYNTSKVATLKFDDNRNFTCTVTNTKITGNLTVSKTVTVTGADLNDADRSREFNFTVTLSDNTINGTYGDMSFENGVAKFTLKHGESKTASKLPVGVTYTVVEQATADYSTTAVGDKGTISEAGATAAFVNNRAVEKPLPKTGSLTVNKTVVVNGAEMTDADRSAEFNFTVTLSDTSINGVYGAMEFVNGVATFTLKHNESKTASNLPTGVEYTVTEREAAGYTATAAGETGTISEAGAVVAFTNTRTVTPPPNTPNDPGDDNPGGDDDPELPPVPTTNIEEPPVPLTETPTEEVIFDEEVPLTGMPEEDEEILLDEEVPLAKVPKTGDNLILWFFAAVASAIGALGLGRKRD